MAMPKIEVNGVEHTLVVLKVEARDQLGRPSTCSMGYDGDTFSVENGAEFITAWVPTHVTAPETKATA